MNKFAFLGFLLILAFKGHAQVLPSIFYAPAQEQRSFCRNNKDADTWFKLLSEKIQKHRAMREANGLKKDVLRNLYVTWSYAELLQLSQSRTDVGARAVGTMGHIYANASHHLGRIVRYRYWDNIETNAENEHIVLQDRALVTDGLLGRTVETFPTLVAHRLMQHSLDLYETLSWVLGATLLCGPQYSLDLIEDYKCDFWGRCDILPGLRGLGLQLQAFEHLKNSLQLIQERRLLAVQQLQEFSAAFVRFEQFYLQHTMYNQPDIGTSASLGLLDSMRFIPFNGVKSLSFRQWCRADQSCQGSSINLEQRIRFDQKVISDEISQTSGSRPRMGLRGGHRMIRQVRRLILE